MSCERPEHPHRWTVSRANFVRALMITVAVTAVLLSACADLTGPTERGTLRPGVAAHDEAPCTSDCLSPEQYAKVQAAINNLKNSWDGACLGAGIALQSRLDAGLIHYNALGDPRLNNPAAYSYYPGQDVYVTDKGFAGGPGQMENSLAHEESHLSMGTEDNRTGSNSAYEFGDSCAFAY